MKRLPQYGKNNIGSNAFNKIGLDIVFFCKKKTYQERHSKSPEFNGTIELYLKNFSN